jgi:hypothetical protein
MKMEDLANLLKTESIQEIGMEILKKFIDRHSKVTIKEFLNDFVGISAIRCDELLDSLNRETGIFPDKSYQKNISADNKNIQNGAELVAKKLPIVEKPFITEPVEWLTIVSETTDEVSGVLTDEKTVNIETDDKKEKNRPITGRYIKKNTENKPIIHEEPKGAMVYELKYLIEMARSEYPIQSGNWIKISWENGKKYSKPFCKLTNENGEQWLEVVDRIYHEDGKREGKVYIPLPGKIFFPISGNEAIRIMVV